MVPHAAGLAIFTEGRRKLLLVHPTGAPWSGTYSIPKGLLDPGEDPLEGALRETREETGVAVPREWVDPTPNVVEYRDKRGRVTKRVTWFAADAPDGALPERLPKGQLQAEEIDWAGFLGREEAEGKVLRHFAGIVGRLGA